MKKKDLVPGRKYIYKKYTKEKFTFIKINENTGGVLVDGSKEEKKKYSLLDGLIGFSMNYFLSYFQPIEED